MRHGVKTSDWSETYLTTFTEFLEKLSERKESDESEENEYCAQEDVSEFLIAD